MSERQRIDDAEGYAAQQWQGMMSMPLADFSAVQQAVVEEAQSHFIREAAADITQRLTPDGSLDTTLITLWALAR